MAAFHSSYLPRALQAADDAGVDPYRLIVELGRQDVMRLPDELLEQTVVRLRDRARPTARPDVARFSDARFGPRRIATRPEAIGELLDGLEVVAAKRHLAVVLDLVPSPVLDEETVTTEFVLEDDHMALGRLRFGSAEAAVGALDGRTGIVTLALIDAADAATVAGLAGVLRTGLSPYRSDELELEILGDAALRADRRARGELGGACRPCHLSPLARRRVANRLRRSSSIRDRGRRATFTAGRGSVAGPWGRPAAPGPEHAIFLGAREGATFRRARS